MQAYFWLWLVLSLANVTDLYIGVGFLLIKQIPREQNVFAKLGDISDLINLVQSRTLPPKSIKDKKKVFAALWFYPSSEFRISCWQVAITWQKTKGARHISPPSVSDLRGHHLPTPPKIDPYRPIKIFFSKVAKISKITLLMLFHNEVKTVRNSLKVLSFCVVIMRFLNDVIWIF